MCGILGLIGVSCDLERLEEASKLMKHRGPDQSGTMQDGTISLAHRRLSIIDLSEHGKQPMTNEDESIWIVFNGMIYGHHELRKQLSTNHVFKSKSDTEVLIHGYEEWGIEGLLERVDGMFAFSIWDKTKGKVFIARDRLGKKPLFYSFRNSTLSFSSSLNSLVELCPHSLTISGEAIQEYLVRTHISAPKTIYNEVSKLKPAHYIEFDTKGLNLELKRYWLPNFRDKIKINEKEAVQETKGRLIEAVRRRLDSDVPVGAFLSGGIDSSLITSIMSKELGQKMNTYTIRFDIDKYNEADAASEIADSLGSDHTEVPFDLNITNEIEDIVWHYGEPFGDHSMLPTFLVAKAARKDVGVVLTGDGGDEGFAGYYNSYALKVAKHFNSFLRPGFFRSIVKKSPLGSVKKMRWLLELNAKKGGRYVYDPVGNKGYRREFNKIIADKSSSDKDLLKIDEHNDLLWNAEPLTWEDKGLFVDLQTTLPNNMLTKVDVATMAFGLEARSPFLDKNLMDFAFSIDADVKLKGYTTKYILRTLAREYLPASITDRPKQGFSLPVDEWITENEQFVMDYISSGKIFLSEYVDYEYFDELIKEHYSGQVKQGRRIWLMLILSIWIVNRKNK